MTDSNESDKREDEAANAPGGADHGEPGAVEDAPGSDTRAAADSGAAAPTEPTPKTAPRASGWSRQRWGAALAGVAALGLAAGGLGGYIGGNLADDGPQIRPVSVEGRFRGEPGERGERERPPFGHRGNDNEERERGENGSGDR